MLAIKSYMGKSIINSEKKLAPVRIEIGIHSDAFLTELSWQVLTEGYLTSILLVHQLTVGHYMI